MLSIVYLDQLSGARHSHNSGFYQNPFMGDLAIFSTGTYAIIGTTCVESETCNEKYHEKKYSLWTKMVLLFLNMKICSNKSNQRILLK